MPTHLRLLLASLFVLFCCGPPSFGQATEAGIKARLKNKPLYLRGLWRDANLNFDADGKLVGQSLPTSFTLTGFEFRSAQIKKDKLQIEGKRIGVEFDKDMPNRVSLGQMIKVNIALPANGDFTQSLDAIFADGLTELVPSLPSYWQRWAKWKLAPPNASITTTGKTTAPGNAGNLQTQSATAEAPLKKVGGGVSAPRLTVHRDAEFSEAARQLKYSGNTVIGFVVNTDGVPDHLHVVRPVGVGLDEQALAAVLEYRFKPAMQNGKAVRVEADVVVSFSIF